MITISTQDILTVEENACSYDVLKNLIQDYPNVKVGIYNNGKIKKILTYEDLFSEREVIEEPLVHGADVFEQARDLFFAHDNKYSCIPVTNAEGALEYILCNEPNQVDVQNYVSDFAHYNIEDSRIDYELLNRGDVFIIPQLEEYTYQIARIIEKKFPEKWVFFLDQNVEFFFDGTSNVRKITSINEFYFKYKHLLNKSIFTINSGKDFTHNTMRFIAKTYSSLEVMTSLFWSCDVTSFGEKNPDKTFYLIKNPLLNGGIADLIKFTLFRVEMVMHKPEKYIPVIDLSLKEECNQFTRGNGDNTWTYFFEQICDVPLSEVYESKNVIISKDELELFNPYVQEYAYFMDWKTMFGDYLRFNDTTREYVEKSYVETIPKGCGKCLGVIGRGTDYRSSKGRWVPNPLEPEALLGEVINHFKEWQYDYIFLATEDEEVFRLFMDSELKERILYVDQERVDYSNPENKDLFLSEIKERDNVDGYEDGLRYLGILYILSKCDSLISSATCGASNIVQGLKQGEFEHVLIYGN